MLDAALPVFTLRFGPGSNLASFKAPCTILDMIPKWTHVRTTGYST